MLMLSLLFIVVGVFVSIQIDSLRVEISNIFSCNWQKRGEEDTLIFGIIEIMLGFRIHVSRLTSQDGDLVARL